MGSNSGSGLTGEGVEAVEARAHGRRAAVLRRALRLVVVGALLSRLQGAVRVEEGLLEVWRIAGRTARRRSAIDHLIRATTTSAAPSPVATHDGPERQTGGAERTSPA
jgi:hypothetical protein